MKTIAFQPGHTWRKLGFALYSDSLAYREVLEDNPQWEVLTHPPLGAAIKSRRSPGSSVGLSQQSLTITPIQNSSSDVYFPFESELDYLTATFKYSPSALRDVERNNGWSANSVVSDVGLG